MTNDLGDTCTTSNLNTDFPYQWKTYKFSEVAGDCADFVVSCNFLHLEWVMGSAATNAEFKGIEVHVGETIFKNYATEYLPIAGNFGGGYQSQEQVIYCVAGCYGLPMCENNKRSFLQKWTHPAAYDHA